MAHGYQIINQQALHFITLTTVGWIDIFSYLRYKELIINNLDFCIREKGLLVYAWVIMSNHIHLICKVKDGFQLSNVIRDFKSFTAKELLKEIQKNTESRRTWMLHIMKFEASYNKRNDMYQVWQQENYPIELESPDWIVQKLNYIHNNPVRAGIVDDPIEYRHSSARAYSGKKGLLDIELLDLGPSIGYISQ